MSGSSQQQSNPAGEKEYLLNDKQPDGQQKKDLKRAYSMAEDKAPKEDSGSTLIIAFFLMLLFQLGNRIFGRLSTYPMHNYPIFMTMLSTGIYIPICFAYIIPMITYTTSISKEQQEIPKYKFAVMGAYDSLAGIMQTFAVNYITNSSTIVLVQQSAIPISMLISKLALQAQYTFSQYLGAGVVLMGIVIVLLPNFFSTPHPTTAAAPGAGHSSSELLWISILVVSCVPMCLSSVYKEMALGEMEINVVFLNGWVAIYQFLFAIPLCIPSTQVVNMSVFDIVPNLYGGMRCWFGINSIDEHNRTGNMVIDNCTNAPLFVNTYLVFNIVFNILIVVILKHGSANILWMASTVIVPLSNVAFSLNIMPGHQPLKSFDIVGLFVIMGGLVLYRFTAQIISVVEWISGKEHIEDAEAEKRARLVGIRAEGKQTKYVGLNQVEALQSLIDTRVWKEQKVALSRSSQQIRGSLLLRLGIPPSPLISLDPAQRRQRGDFARSPTAPSIQKSPIFPMKNLKAIPPGSLPDSMQRNPQNRVARTGSISITAPPPLSSTSSK